MIILFICFGNLYSSIFKTVLFVDPTLCILIISSRRATFEKKETAMKSCPLEEMPIPVEISIQQHSDDIISGKIPEPEVCFPRCFSKPETFKLHECRKRAFRYIAGNFVKVLITLLARWKCSDCGKTFTIFAPLLQYDGCQGNDQANAQTNRTRTGDDWKEKARIGRRGLHHICAVSSFWV